jgi:hypothetical protein
MIDNANMSIPQEGLSPASPPSPPGDGPSILLGYVHPGTVHNCFVVSLLRLVNDRTQEIAIMGVGSGPLIARMRNNLVGVFLENKFTHFLSVDTDIEFAPDALHTLLDLDLPIVGATYRGVSSSGSSFPVAIIKGKDGLYERASFKRLGKKGVTEVVALGMGFTLIKREVLEALGVAALWPFAETLDDKGQPLGEDTTFCLRAADVGFKSYLCLDVRVGHMKRHII